MYQWARCAIAVLALQVGSEAADLPLPPAIQSAFRIGGSGTAIRSMVVDRGGNLYLAGTISGTGFQAVGKTTLGVRGGNSDLFVVKIAPTGPSVGYVAEIGGSDVDELGGMAVDASGNVLLAGRTNSPDFPSTAGAFREKSARGGAFILKLSPTGKNLAFSTYLDDSYVTAATAVAVDPSGDIYCAGLTDSRTFPTLPGAFMRNVGMEAGSSQTTGFVARISSDGSRLLASTLFGGSFGHDRVVGLSVGPGGIIHIAGMALSGAFPTTPGAPRPAPPLLERRFGYVARLDGWLSRLLFCSLFDTTDAVALQTDAQGSSYVAGGFSQFDVAKFDGGGALVYSRSFGGAEADRPMALVVLDDGSAVVVGDTISPDFPTRDTMQPCVPNLPGEPRTPGYPDLGDGANAVILKLDPAGNLTHSSLLGGIGWNSLHSIVKSVDGSLFISGCSTSLEFGGSLKLIPGATDNLCYTLKVDLSLVVRGRPAPACLANSATFRYAPAAPGAFATLYGSNLGPSKGAEFRLGPDGRVPTELGGMRVTVNGLAAPITYAQDTQVNFLVPQGVTSSTADICVESRTGRSCLFASVQPWNQGVFKVGDRFAVLNQDGTLNTPENRATRGSVIAIWGTGFGPYTSPIPDGAVAAPPLGRLVYLVQAEFPDPAPPFCIFGICRPPRGPFRGEVEYAGPAPGLVNGVTQINVRIPMDAIPGTGVPLKLWFNTSLPLADYITTAMVWLDIK